MARPGHLGFPRMAVEHFDFKIPSGMIVLFVCKHNEGNDQILLERLRVHGESHSLFERCF